MHRNSNPAVDRLLIGLAAAGVVAIITIILVLPVWAIVFLTAIVFIGAMFGAGPNP